MTACKVALCTSAAALGATTWGAIAGFCPRVHATICGGMMLFCMAICARDLLRDKQRRAREEAARRAFARENMKRAAHIAYFEDLLRQIR